MARPVLRTKDGGYLMNVQRHSHSGNYPGVIHSISYTLTLPKMETRDWVDANTKDVWVTVYDRTSLQLSPQWEQNAMVATITTINEKRRGRTYPSYRITIPKILCENVKHKMPVEVRYSDDIILLNFQEELF